MQVPREIELFAPRRCIPGVCVRCKCKYASRRQNSRVNRMTFSGLNQRACICSYEIASSTLAELLRLFSFFFSIGRISVSRRDTFALRVFDLRGSDVASSVGSVGWLAGQFPPVIGSLHDPASRIKRNEFVESSVCGNVQSDRWNSLDEG